MSAPADKRVADMIADKAAAELAAALPAWGVAASGPAPADVFAVKGMAGPDDVAAGHALGGADGEALRKALEALGWPADFLALCVEQPEGHLSPRNLALAIEAVDPDLVLALDAVAVRSIAEAIGVEDIGFGDALTVAGRTVGAVDDLWASLTDEPRKRRVWRQLKAVAREA